MITPAQIRAQIRMVEKRNANAKIPFTFKLTRQMRRARERAEAKSIVSEAKLRAHKGKLFGGAAAV